MKFPQARSSTYLKAFLNAMILMPPTMTVRLTSMPNKPGWSKRTTCAKCGVPTTNTRLCQKHRDEENLVRARKRAEWAEEGRCVTCSRIVLEENPRTRDLYKSCKICRKRKTLKGYGKTPAEINLALRKIGGRLPNPNA